ncbi:MAG: class II aldolase/adducin family protein [archaeon]
MVQSATNQNNSIFSANNLANRCAPISNSPASIDGYIKFNSVWDNIQTTLFSDFSKLNAWRQKLLNVGLIGVYPNGIGFGNLSCRVGTSKEFYITGSATGGLAKLSKNQYTKVIDFDFEKNWLSCAGGIIASSESLTHAAVYSCAPKVTAVFHAHNKVLWEYLLEKYPSTSKSAAYGTLKMAKEVFRLFRENIFSKHKIFAMAGHEEGVVAFGDSLEEAGNVLLEHFAFVR